MMSLMKMEIGSKQQGTQSKVDPNPEQKGEMDKSMMRMMKGLCPT
jgi:hypothetical protein